MLSPLEENGEVYLCRYNVRVDGDIEQTSCFLGSSL